MRALRWAAVVGGLLLAASVSAQETETVNMPPGWSAETRWVRGTTGVVDVFSPSLTVTSPNGGETWEIDTVESITWSSADMGMGTVTIEVSRDNGGSWSEIFSEIDNDGDEDWIVTSPATVEALIRVTSDDDASITDTSDAVFEITSVSQSDGLTVTSPDGGEDWKVTSEQTITWTSTGSPGAVDVELSRNNGSSYEVLADATANDGSFDYTVAGATTSEALVRVRDDATGDVSDTSDATFTISAEPTITVTAPNGSEEWEQGTQHEITWTSTNVDGTVSIEYSEDGGANYVSLFPNETNDGSRTWTVNQDVSSTSRIRITADDAGDLGASDESDADFSVTAETADVTAPTVESFTTSTLGTAGTTFTVDMPSTRPDDDLYVFFVVHTADTALTEDGALTELIELGHSGGTHSTWVGYRVGSSEPASYDFTTAAAEEFVGFVMRLSGYDPDAGGVGVPIDVNGDNDGVTDTPVLPSITTTQDGCLLIGFNGADGPRSQDPGYEPTGYTPHASQNSSGGGTDAVLGQAVSIEQASAGASGTADMSMSTTDQWVTHHLAVCGQ